MREHGINNEEEANRWMSDPFGYIKNQVEPWLQASSWYMTERPAWAPTWEPLYDGKPVAFMLRFANMWAPRQLPLPLGQEAGPSNLVKCAGFPRVYTSVLQKRKGEDAFLLLLQSGMTELVDRVVMFLILDNYYDGPQSLETKALVTQTTSQLTQRYAQHPFVCWLVKERYSGGVLEGAFFHAIGLPYIVHCGEVIPAQTWPVVGQSPISGSANDAWSLAVLSRLSNPIYNNYSVAIEPFAYEIGNRFLADSLETERDRTITTSVTYALVLRWLLHHGLGRTAFQMARVCRLSLCVYHSILIPTYWGFMQGAEFKDRIMRRYFGDDGGAQFLGSDANGFRVLLSLSNVIKDEPYHLPALHQGETHSMDPYCAFSSSPRRAEVFAQAFRGMLFYEHFTF